jgi:predicted amidohydrolase YtcJ
MKQTIRRNTLKKIMALTLVMSIVFGMGMLTSCMGKNSADLVVYGKIFTSENNQIVEAFAVKDGKYVYVGDKKGAEAFVEEGKTEVVDYTDKGLVMPGCGNGHAHYMLGYALQTIGTTIDFDADPQKFLTEIVPAAVKKARESGAASVFGQGWNYLNFKNNLPTRQQLDAICSDIPMYFLDDECHKALTNTLMLKKAGIINEDGTAGRTEIRGGEIGVDAKGIPNGFLSEQAQTYARSFIDTESLYPLDRAISNLAAIKQQLFSEGYTMYHEGWGNYFVNTNYYQAAQQLDQEGQLNFVLGLPYEFESWMDIDEALGRAVDVKKFASTHVIPRWIKILYDGTVETGTGIIEPLYLDGHQGIANWTEEELTDITRKANANGLTMHVHVMGNKAVSQVVNAFINGGKDEMRNTLVHVYNVCPEDYQRMADHNIQVAGGLLWHHADEPTQEELLRILPEGLKDKGYPMKSFFDHGVNVSSHSDFPALSASPDDPFGIMEIAVTGVYHVEGAKPWWTEELLTREQVLSALTINVAKQMFIENERGSISTGKYADFLLVDKDVLSCPVTEIHTAKPAATYFEGKKVYPYDEEVYSSQRDI